MKKEYFNYGIDGGIGKFGIQINGVQYSPPTSVSWNNLGGIIPEEQNTLYSGMILLGNKSFTGCTGMNIVSTGGGTISGLTIDGTGRLVFNYTTPSVDPDTLLITGTNAIGGALSISLVVPLPF